MILASLAHASGYGFIPRSRVGLRLARLSLALQASIDLSKIQKIFVDMD